MAYSAEAFNAGNQPGRGSRAGACAPGTHGRWVPANHPDAMPDASSMPTPGTRVQAEDGAAGGAGVGASAGEAGPSGPALAGLSRASSMSSGSASGVQQMPAPDASNPMLGQRIY